MTDDRHGVMARLRAEMAETDARVRAILADNPEALATYVASMEHVASGGSALESLWSALTALQRRTAQGLWRSDACAVRISKGAFRIGEMKVPAATLVALSRRGLARACGAPEDEQQIFRGTELLYKLERYRAGRH